MKLTTLLILALSIATAQTAKVVPISEHDAAMLESAAGSEARYARLYDEEVKRVEAKYLAVGDRDKNRSDSKYFGEGDTLLISSGTIGWATGISIGSPQLDPKVDPCYYSYSSVACLEKQLAEARAKEAKGEKPEPTPHYRYWRSGFEGGYEFSEGFKFVVPKPKVIDASPWRYGGYLSIPAVTQP